MSVYAEEALKRISLVVAAICLIVSMWQGVRIGLTVALLCLGLSEIMDAVELHKNQKKNLAIVPFGIGIFLCGCVLVEVLEGLFEEKRAALLSIIRPRCARPPSSKRRLLVRSRGEVPASFWKEVARRVSAETEDGLPRQAAHSLRRFKIGFFAQGRHWVTKRGRTLASSFCYGVS